MPPCYGEMGEARPFSFSVTQDVLPLRLEIALSGEYDFPAYKSYLAAFQAIPRELLTEPLEDWSAVFRHYAEVVIDVRGLTLLSSHGVALLLRLVKIRRTTNAGKIVLKGGHNTPSHVRKVLEILNIPAYFDEVREIDVHDG